ncbi:MAG: hypothetical protein LBQ75_10720, partial [Zoogloeaceae bacterium]|nr:hypothetical protein [Zoogloeaceae bacterium]
MSNISFNPDALKRTDSNEGSMSGRMKAVWFIVKWLWWLGVAYLPYALDTLRQDFRDSIGCSP